MRKVKTTFSASEFITHRLTVMFYEMSINYVNLPNKECFMIHSITNGLKSIFPLPKLTKIPLEAWRSPFFSSFSSSQLFRFRRQTSNEMEPAWLTMLRRQAAENSLTTSGAAKKVLFSSSDN